VHHIARQYEHEMGVAAFVFDGSGPGMEELGTLVIPSERQRVEESQSSG
jgi:hypothetical protein